MLQDIRERSTGWISKAIIGLIAVLLSFTGFEAIMSSASNSNNAAKVNGEEITLDALAQEKSMQQRQLAQQFGSGFDLNQLDDKLLNEMALNSLVNRKLLLQATADAGFISSDAVIDQFILQFPEFQQDGVFSKERYDQVLRQMGYGRLQFRSMLDQDMRISQLQAGVSSSAFVTAQEASSLLQLQRQIRDFSVLELKPDLDVQQVDEAAIEAYYQKESERFMTPEQVVLEYIQASKADLAERIDVEDDELRQAYDAAIANLAEQRRAAHILFAVEEGEDDTVAQGKIRDVAERIAGGADFAELARELSDDPGSAQEGGDLGFAGPGVYEPEFETVLYELGKGDVSEPVQTAFGWHLIKLLDVQESDIPAFAELKPRLLADVRLNKAEQEFVELVDALESAAYEAADLQQPAQELGLEVRESPAFGRIGGEGIFANRQVLDAAFSELVLEEHANSHALELDNDTVVVLRLKEHRKPEAIALENVRDEIADLLRLEQARKATRTEGETLLAEARGGNDSGDWQRFEAATRQQDDVDPRVLQAVFRMPKPEQGKASFTGLSLPDGRYAVVRLSGVSVPEEAPSDDEVKAFRDVLASRQGQNDFSALSSLLEQEAKIEKF